MKVTKHAMARIKERKMTQEMLVACLRDGKRLVNKWDANKKTIVLNNYNGVDVYMVTDQDEKFLITVWVK